MSSIMSNNTAKQTKSQPLIEILFESGAGFVLVRKPGEIVRLRNGSERLATGKEPIGKNWQQRPQSLEAALAHVRRGGNVGVLGGHNNIILLDADADADKVEQAEPRLRNTIKIVRSNAPERAKWIVKVNGQLPKSQKAHGKLEILSTGTQGVVVGVHHSSAKLEFTGQEIVTLTTEEIAQLWQRVVGKEFEKPMQKTSPTANNEKLEKSMRFVDKVMKAGNLQPSAWRDYQDGAKIVTLEACPFVERTDEPNRQHSAPHKSFVFVSADGQINAGCHAARCQHAIHEHGKGGWSLLKEIVGWKSEPTVDPKHQRELIAALEKWVRRADFAEHVPPRLQAANGYRTRDTDVVVASVILRLAREQGRTTKIVLPRQKLREMANLGSTSTVHKVLERLSGWFIVQDEAPQNRSHAFTYSIHPSILAVAEEMIELHIGQIDSEKNVVLLESTNVPSLSIYQTKEQPLPIATHSHRDAFSSTLRPMTEEELQEKIDKREEEIAAGLDVKPIQRSRYARRLDAALPSLGRGVLRLIDRLVYFGGTASRKDLREALHYTSDSLSRVVSRAAELGLVSANRREVTLHEAWEELIDAFEPYMPTAGRGQDRIIADLNATIRYINMQLRQKDLPEGEVKRLKRRKERCASRKRKLQMMERPDLPAPNPDVAPPSAYEFYMYKKMDERHTQAKLALAEERLADALRLQEEVRRLRSQGVTRREARRMLEWGDWGRANISAAINALWPRQCVATT